MNIIIAKTTATIHSGVVAVHDVVMHAAHAVVSASRSLHEAVQHSAIARLQVELVALPRETRAKLDDLNDMRDEAEDLYHRTMDTIGQMEDKVYEVADRKAGDLKTTIAKIKAL